MRIDITGHVFGSLTAVSFLEARGGYSYWKCRCICGNEIAARIGDLRSGNTKSCGCLRRNLLVQRNKATVKHGHASEGISRTYYSWVSMKSRCSNPSVNGFESYGGRGIKVCERWSDFSAFLEDMGERPKGHTLERKDVNGDYCKDNCIWATNHDQYRNKRNNVFIDYDGESLILPDWSRKTGIATRTLSERLKAGWSVEETLTTPVGKRR